MSDSSQIHRGFMVLSCHFHGTVLSASQLCRIHRGFHVTFMAVSWHFHTQALPGYSLPKSVGKSYPKSWCWMSIWFFALCQIHVGFMALSWRFLPSDCYCFSKQFYGTCMADSWQIHGAFMALSWHFPGTFLFGYVWICHENAMEVP